MKRWIWALSIRPHTLISFPLLILLSCIPLCSALHPYQRNSLTSNQTHGTLTHIGTVCHHHLLCLWRHAHKIAHYFMHEVTANTHPCHHQSVCGVRLEGLVVVGGCVYCAWAARLCVCVWGGVIIGATVSSGNMNVGQCLCGTVKGSSNLPLHSHIQSCIHTYIQSTQNLFLYIWVGNWTINLYWCMLCCPFSSGLWVRPVCWLATPPMPSLVNTSPLCE